MPFFQSKRRAFFMTNKKIASPPFGGDFIEIIKENFNLTDILIKYIIVVGQKDVRTSTNANDWHRQYRK